MTLAPTKRTGAEFYVFSAPKNKLKNNQITNQKSINIFNKIIKELDLPTNTITKPLNKTTKLRPDLENGNYLINEIFHVKKNKNNVFMKCFKVNNNNKIIT